MSNNCNFVLLISIYYHYLWHQLCIEAKAASLLLRPINIFHFVLFHVDLVAVVNHFAYSNYKTLGWLSVCAVCMRANTNWPHNRIISNFCVRVIFLSMYLRLWRSHRWRPPLSPTNSNKIVLHFRVRNIVQLFHLWNIYIIRTHHAHWTAYILQRHYYLFLLYGIYELSDDLLSAPYHMPFVVRRRFIGKMMFWFGGK